MNVRILSLEVYQADYLGVPCVIVDTAAWSCAIVVSIRWQGTSRKPLKRMASRSPTLRATEWHRCRKAYSASPILPLRDGVCSLAEQDRKSVV